MFLSHRFYIAGLIAVALMACGFMWPSLFTAGAAWLAVTVALTAVDAAVLFMSGRVEARRKVEPVMSNGDDNKVTIQVSNGYPFAASLEVIDEIPAIFQRRDLSFKIKVSAKQAHAFAYTLRPTKRGSYDFGHIVVMAATPLGLAQRRMQCGTPWQVKVYPSYARLRQYEFMALNNQLVEAGTKRIRRAGNQTEFEQIKDYVTGDDFRTINWKATARRTQLMVNVYQDERSQQLISIIDKGRVMQQAFHGMTLLDHAINATLALSHVAIAKGDNAGLITVEKNIDSSVKPGHGALQMRHLLDTLCNQTTTYGETDLSALCMGTAQWLRKRSLLILYTNFLSFNAMMRQLPFLRQLNSKHRLLVVFFDDEQLRDYVNRQASTTQDIYCQVVGEKLLHEKQLIVSTLKQHGIYALLTRPQSLTTDVINRYLEMKSRQLF